MTIQDKLLRRMNNLPDPMPRKVTRMADCGCAWDGEGNALIVCAVHTLQAAQVVCECGRRCCGLEDDDL